VGRQKKQKNSACKVKRTDNFNKSRRIYHTRPSLGPLNKRNLMKKLGERRKRAWVQRGGGDIATKKKPLGLGVETVGTRWKQQKRSNFGESQNQNRTK